MSRLKKDPASPSENCHPDDPQPSSPLSRHPAAIQNLLENMTDGYALLEEVRDQHSNVIDYIVHEVSTIAQQTIGLSRESLLGSRLTDIFVHNPSIKPVVADIILNVALSTERQEYEKKIGESSKWFSWTTSRTSPDTISLLFRDTTARRATQAELAKVHHLESLGVLAGGIAHEFNNLFQGIIGHISVAQSVLKETGIAKNSLEKALVIADRATELSNQLLTFSKGGRPKKGHCCIEKIAREVLDFSLLSSRVEGSLKIGDAIWQCLADEGQMRQAISNIVLNAAEAKPANGQVQITAENIRLGPNNSLALGEGPYLKVTVSDTGTGIPEKVQGKIFDPFFSTKSFGRGLGLTTAFSIITKHDGAISVESEHLVGTTVTVHLPAIEEVTAPPPAKTHSLPKGGTILLMDDEAFIRETLSHMLATRDFQSTCVSEGSAAVEAYRRSMRDGKKFDAVILDLTIRSGMGGREVIRRLREIDPDIRAIVSSGYSDDLVLANPLAYGFSAVLPKPYGMKELNRALATVLADDEGDGADSPATQAGAADKVKPDK